MFNWYVSPSFFCPSSSVVSFAVSELPVWFRLLLVHLARVYLGTHLLKEFRTARDRTSFFEPKLCFAVFIFGLHFGRQATQIEPCHSLDEMWNWMSRSNRTKRQIQLQCHKYFPDAGEGDTKTQDWSIGKITEMMETGQVMAVHFDSREKGYVCLLYKDQTLYACRPTRGGIMHAIISVPLKSITDVFPVTSLHLTTPHLASYLTSQLISPHLTSRHRANSQS
jgi:hypothetical protein